MSWQTDGEECREEQKKAVSLSWVCCTAGGAIHIRTTPANLWAGVRHVHCSGTNENFGLECCCGL